MHYTCTVISDEWDCLQFFDRELGLSDYAPGLCDYADSLCRDYAPTNSYDYAEIMLLESGYAEIMLGFRFITRVF